jgi:hypothetical protein
MKNGADIAFAVIFALAITYADRIFISGPYLGLPGVLLSMAAAIIGWYLARLATGLIPDTSRSVGGVGYSMVPLMFFTVLTAVIFAALAYVKIFDLTKVDYTSTDVFYHLLLVVLAAFVIRMAAKAVRQIAG